MSEVIAKNENTRASEQGQYLTFMLGTEVFAIGILAIKEIIEYGSLTEVPMMPDSVRGVINLRGAVVPVMDLSVRFGKPASGVTKRTCIVIVETEREGQREVIGVVVDAVNAVLEISSEDIEPPPSFGPKIRTEFIEGLGKVNGKFVILIATDRVLAIEGLESARTELSGTGESARSAAVAAGV
jgi:purine-binding chemotaxis protein CheW